MDAEKLDSAGQLLLDQGLTLSALELWMEALESGVTLPSLKRFFSDFRKDGGPGNSVLQSAVMPATDDELMALSSHELLQRLKESEEKLSLTRYQLDLANEQLRDEQKNKHAESAHETATAAEGGAAVEASDVSASMSAARDAQRQTLENGPALDAVEHRILNFLLRNYMQAQGYKMTLITMAEEVPSFASTSVWKMMKLDMPEPPSLSALLRYYYSAGAQRLALELARDPSLNAQLDQRTNERDRLSREVEALKRDLASATSRAEQLESEKMRLLATWEHDLEEVRENMRRDAREQQERLKATLLKVAEAGTSQPNVTESSDAGAEGQPVTEAENGAMATAAGGGSDDEDDNNNNDALQPVEDLDYLFSRRLFPRQWLRGDEDASSSLRSNSNLLAHIKVLGTIKRDDLAGLVRVFAECLPNVVPGIILRSREEVLPLLLGTIRQTKDTAVRERLTGLLIGLVKKPDASQRRMIVHAVALLAELVGRERTEREVMPHIRDGSTHKSEERRLLVADACGALMPFVRDSVRGRMMLEILRPLVDDSSAAVRVAAAKNVGLLVTFCVDTELFEDIFGCFKKLLLDADENVGKVALNDVLPKLADWACAAHRLESAMIDKVVADIETQLAQSQMDRVGMKRLAMTADALTALFPFLFRIVLAWAPFSDEVLHCTKEDARRFVLSRDDENALRERLREFLKHELDLPFAAEDFKWTAVQFFVNTFAPGLVRLIGSVSLAERRAQYLTLVAVVDGFWKVFDVAFTTGVFGSSFLKAMENADTRNQLVPAYVASVLARRPETEFLAFFSQSISKMGTQQEGWSAEHHLPGLRLAVELVGRNPQRLEGLLNVAKEHSQSEHALTRAVAISVFERLVTLCSENELRTIIVPALAEKDAFAEDVAVKKALIRALGTIGSATNDTKILDAVSAQLDAIAGATPEVLEELMTTLSDIVTSVDAGFRDKKLMPKIRHAAELNAKQEDAAVKGRVAASIFQAYRVFLECAPKLDVLVSEVAPGLEILKLQLTDDASVVSVTAALATIASKAPQEPVVNTAAASSTAASSANATTAGATTAAASTKKEESAPTLQKARDLFGRFKFGKSDKAAAAPAANTTSAGTSTTPQPTPIAAAPSTTTPQPTPPSTPIQPQQTATETTTNK